MDHIKQLKQIRADAISRMRNSPDFKLAGKLGLLIVELGEKLEDSVDFADPEPESRHISREMPVKNTFPATSTSRATPLPFTTSFSRPHADDFADLASDEMIDELVAEIEGDAAELDAIMAETADEQSNKPFGPPARDKQTDGPRANGAAH